jgi:hypothetical protein
VLSELEEGDLIFSFDAPAPAIRFDNQATHGIGHGMKRVDFIVEEANNTLLIEVKDPENRRIPPGRATIVRQKFRRSLRSGSFFRSQIVPKLKDTLTYLALSHRAPVGDITYVVVVALSRPSDAALRQTGLEILKKLCHMPGPHGRPWASNFNVVLLDIAAFNRHLYPHNVRRR